ncbi:hypothetical protein Hanom_Chr15g01342851 [Helianthus anomalus]
MTIKVKPQGSRFKKFEIWTKMAKLPKPQGPKWQFTLLKKLFLGKIRLAKYAPGSLWFPIKNELTTQPTKLLGQ